MNENRLYFAERLPMSLPSPLYGTAFGSYSPDDVAWLLTDLSHVELEQPAEDREGAMQSGEGHYAESLPIEYVPTAAYHETYERNLTDNASLVATLVGTLAERILRAKDGEPPTLVSLARAGTPVGILLKRWYARYYPEMSVPHYTVSIVRGKGIDQLAMEYLITHHDDRSIVFVDGWTGKGAITEELTEAIRSLNFQWGTDISPALAVLADPGQCADYFGTREDVMIPSSALNSTISGLVSRTIYNTKLLSPESQFHGAKYYAEMHPHDLSNSYLNAIETLFDRESSIALLESQMMSADYDKKLWVGYREAKDLAIKHKMNSINLVKPGIGETTRVLLRRTPWKVLVNTPDYESSMELAHIIELARDKNVPIIYEPALSTYQCCGLIKPIEPTISGTTDL